MYKEKISGIYCIENLINGKKYIGLSSNMQKRWKSHKNALINDSHINKHLQSAWNKYGEKNFKFYVIEHCSKNELTHKEIFYIKKYKTRNRRYGYNKTSGGDGVADLSEESAQIKKEKTSSKHIIKFDLNGKLIKQYLNSNDAAKELKEEKKYKSNLSGKNIYRCAQKNTYHKCNHKYYNYVWIFSDLYDENFNYKYINKSTKSIKIVKLDRKCNLLEVYDSLTIAEKENNLNNSSISACAKNKLKTYKGYIWMYYDEYKNLSKEKLINISVFDKYSDIPVIQYDLNMNLIKKYKSINEVLFTNPTFINKQFINKCCDGTLKTAYKSIWKYDRII